MTVTFFGHSDIYPNKIINEAIKEVLRRECAECERITCYVGGYGGFDEACARACMELKRERGGIEVVYVTPYIDSCAQKKMAEMLTLGLCDSTVYPPLEGVPPRYAILKRNEWMITSSQLIIAYVKRSYGGAYRSLKFATLNKKRIINVGERVRHG